LEVLLALVLFGGAMAILATAFSSSMQSLQRQERSALALNMASSVLAEVQLGIRPAVSDGPRAFEAPWQDWTWETSLLPMQTSAEGLSGLSVLEVIVRHQDPPFVQRLAQVVTQKATSGTNSIMATMEL
jgi:type II secretory pathway pseudopilin PulG